MMNKTWFLFPGGTCNLVGQIRMNPTNYNTKQSNMPNESSCQVLWNMKEKGSLPTAGEQRFLGGNNI